MAIKLLIYTPKSGSDISIKVLNNNINISESVAEALFAIRSAEQDDPDAKNFLEHNVPCNLPHGLVFRLFNDESGPSRLALEFLGPIQAEEKARALAEIPGLLKQTGLVDDRAIAQLQSFIQSPPKIRGQ